jgi:hypothetical protein
MCDQLPGVHYHREKNGDITFDQAVFEMPELRAHALTFKPIDLKNKIIIQAKYYNGDGTLITEKEVICEGENG